MSRRAGEVHLADIFEGGVRPIVIVSREQRAAGGLGSGAPAGRRAPGCIDVCKRVLELSTEAAAEYARFLVSVVGPDIARQAAREMVQSEPLRRALRERIEQPLARFVDAYTGRFGEVPSRLREQLECLAPNSLALATLLVRQSEDVAGFNRAFALLVETFCDGHLAGAKKALQTLLERKFGPLEQLHELAIEVADGFALSRCFERFLKVRSARAVVKYLLPRDVRRARRAANHPP